MTQMKGQESENGERDGRGNEIVKGNEERGERGTGPHRGKGYAENRGRMGMGRMWADNKIIGHWRLIQACRII